MGKKRPRQDVGRVAKHPKQPAAAADKLKINFPPPPAYACDAEVLTPGDKYYEPCLSRSYKGFCVDPPATFEKEMHVQVKRALELMEMQGMFHLVGDRRSLGQAALARCILLSWDLRAVPTY